MEILAPSKQQKRMVGPVFSGIRKFTAEVKLASKRSFRFNVFCIKILSKMHPKSVQKLCRIHNWVLLGFETASELILRGLGDLKTIKIAFRSLRNFVFSGKNIASSAEQVNYAFLKRCIPPCAASTLGQAATPTVLKQ